MMKDLDEVGNEMEKGRFFFTDVMYMLLSSGHFLVLMQIPMMPQEDE